VTWASEMSQDSRFSTGSDDDFGNDSSPKLARSMRSTARRASARKGSALSNRLLEAQLLNMKKCQRPILMEGSHQASGEEDSLPPNLLSGATRINVAFRCVTDDESLPLGADFVEAFWLLNHPYPREDWIRDIMTKYLGACRALELDEFVYVVHEYEKKKHFYVRDLFNEVRQEAETMPVEQLPGVLKKLSLPLMPSAEKELVAESPAELDLAMLEQIVEDILSRAGLPVAEYDRLCTAFENLSCLEVTLDQSQKITGHQLLKLLSWHEHSVLLAGGQPLFTALVTQTIESCSNSGVFTIDLERRAKALRMAVKASGMARQTSPGSQAVPQPPVENENWEAKIVTVGAMLAAARTLHYLLEGNLEVAMKKHKRALNASDDFIDAGGLMRIVEDLGFLQILNPALEEFLPEGVDQDRLDFEQLYTFVHSFCIADGTTSAEGQDLETIFKHFDRNHAHHSGDVSGKLDARELGPVIRWLGYQPSLYRIYHFAEVMELTDTSQVTLSEFRKMIAKYQRMSLIAARRSFLNSDGQLPITDMDQMLRLVGYEPADEETSHLIAQAGGEDKMMSFSDFKKLEHYHRKRVRKTMETNGGVSNAELEKYRKYFADQDKNGDGFITPKGMRELLASLFPDTNTSKTRSQRLGKLIKEADSDGNGKFDFEEYIGLMRNVVEDVDRNSLTDGLRLKHDLGYTNTEVKQFLDLYNLADTDMGGTIDVDELIDLFSNLVPMEAEARLELTAMFIEVDDGNGEFDFWEFLTFMRKVQNMNWRNINGVSGKSRAESTFSSEGLN